MTRSPLARESARCSAWPRQTLTRRNEVSPSRHSPSCWTLWVTATRRLATAMPLLVKRSSGSSTRLPTMVVWLSAAMTGAPCVCWLAFGSEAFRPPTSAGGLVAGGLDGIGGSVVLAGLPDVWVGVVLAAVVDGHSDPEGEGGLALGDVAVADAVGVVGGDAEGGVEPVEGLLAGRPGWPVVVAPVVGVELDGFGGQLVVG